MRNDKRGQDSTARAVQEEISLREQQAAPASEWLGYLLGAAVFVAVCFLLTR